jgi:hypothetical protein
MIRGGGGGFKFKSKHSTSRRNLPQFDKGLVHSPPRTPQKQHPISNQVNRCDSMLEFLTNDSDF